MMIVENPARSPDGYPIAHIRHHGVFIDASFKKGHECVVEYYRVQGSCGEFYSIEAAKEIAEHVARRKGK